MPKEVHIVFNFFPPMTYIRALFLNVNYPEFGQNFLKIINLRFCALQ